MGLLYSGLTYCNTIKFHNRIEDAKALCASFLQRHPGNEAIGKALRELERIETLKAEQRRENDDSKFQTDHE
jgi:hypothetical protein